MDLDAVALGGLAHHFLGEPALLVNLGIRA